MTSRILALRRGKNGDVQSFSAARPVNPGTAALLRSTLGGSLTPAVRAQILADPGNVTQFAGIFGETAAYLTRPVVTLEVADNTFWFVGNVTDTIGEPCPAKLGMPEFASHIVTLVRRGDAIALGLAIHPAAPDTLEGPRVRGAAAVASLERLNFPMPDNPADDDFPVVAALPAFYPIPGGEVFPHLFRLDNAQSFRDTALAFEVWRQGWLYILSHNNGRSVTQGGPLFHLPQFDLADGVENPFVNLTILGAVAPTMTEQLLAPDSDIFGLGRAQFLEFSNNTWVELGSTMAPEPPAPAAAVLPGGGFSIEQFGAVMERFTPKEKTFAQSGRTASRYKLFLAGEPTDGTDCVIFPELSPDFVKYLGMPNSAIASLELQELFRSRLVLANHSTQSVDKDVTLETGNVTVAFSDRVRTYGFLTDKLVRVTYETARNQLGLLQLLTPDQEALALAAECDQDAAALLMSNSSSSSAMLDASKSSKMYCGGHLRSFEHVYEAVCNFRCMISLFYLGDFMPLVLSKLMEYVSLLRDRDGRAFFGCYRNSPSLAVHPYQDCQAILSAFARIGTESTLYNAVIGGQAVSIANYRTATDVANALIADLRAIINGNGLGKFAGLPTCARWFSTATPASPAGGAAAGVTSGDAKRQKTQGAPPRVATAEDIEARKKFGMLVFNSTEAGSTSLPTCPVFHKARGARSPERLCMSFLTRGFACAKTDCKFAHVTQLSNLGSADQTKLTEFVRKQRGLSWAPGKAPAAPSGTAG
jgi:hypothetical protein